MRISAFPVPTKLCSFFCVLLGSIVGNSILVSASFAILAFLYLAVQRNWKVVMYYGIFYLILCGLLLLIRYKGLHMVIFSEFHVLMFFTLSPVFLVSWDLITTPPGELSAFLSTLRTPTPVILGVLVLFRFFPTMTSEISGIRQSMRNRGLTTVRQIAGHPLVSFEYVMVPILLHCLQVADQLSISAVARGAESPEKRMSYYHKPMNIRGIICIILCILGTVGILFFEVYR